MISYIYLIFNQVTLMFYFLSYSKIKVTFTYKFMLIFPY